MSIETKLKIYADIQKNSSVNKEKLQCTIKKSKEAFWKSQTSIEVSWLEFLYQQAAYIQKRWWFGQGLLLAILWLILYLSNSNVYERRCVGILIPCFVILFLPELWKNRSSNAMEVEGTAYFSLQKIYAARMLLFGMVDICMLTIFCMVSVFTVRITVIDFLIQLLVPLNVTGCICFGTLHSKRNFSVFSASMLCMGWIVIWISMVLKDGIYENISLPVWLGIIILSFICFCYSIVRVWKDSSNYFEIMGAAS